MAWISSRYRYRADASDPHPTSPGGATALMAVIGSDQLHAMGYLYVLVPAFLGPLVLLGVALIVNNLPRGRSDPECWF